MEYGHWNDEIRAKHLNVKELTNLVETVENAYANGFLVNAEPFLCTDNCVSEAAYYNGGSDRNPELNDLIFRLWNLQMIGNVVV